MSVRAKFRVNMIEDYGLSKKIKMNVVYEGSLGPNEENKRFAKATPNGECWMTVDNPYAADQFKPGDEWYVTFDKVDKPAAVA